MKKKKIRLNSIKKLFFPDSLNSFSNQKTKDYYAFRVGTRHSRKDRFNA